MFNESVRERLFEVYGPEPPVRCLARLEEEPLRIPGKQYEDDARLFHRLRECPHVLQKCHQGIFVKRPC